MRRLASIAIRVVFAVALVSVLVACAQPAPAPEKPKAAAEPTKAPAPTSAPAEQPKPAATAAKPAAQEKPAAPVAKPAEPAKPKEPALVRVGLQATASDAGFYIADAKGYFTAQGIKFEEILFSAPPEMLSALATDKLEVAGIGASQPQFLNAIERGILIKAVGDKGSQPKGGGYMGFVVRKDHVDSGKYKSPADLKGMKVALPPPPMVSSNTPNLDTLLQKNGLTLKDIELVGVPIADMPAALAGRSIDAAWIAEPGVARAVDMGAGVRVFGGDDVAVGHQVSAFNYSPGFVKDKADVGKLFMAAYLKGIRDYNDAFFKNKGKADIIKILTQKTSLKDPAIWEKMVPPGLNPDGYINIESVMRDINWFFNNDQVKWKPKSVEEIIDNQFVDFAVKQLGKYQ
ncbi:MAG: ABC transporter substrate-binding protein [Chloroflexi bacterium]|nr:ABC transporter substrate-binding protein [Chloroflexota bacterium]